MRDASLAVTPAQSNARIRVAIVAPSLDILGGQAIQAQRLLERLRELPDLDVTFVPVNPRLPGVLAALQRVKYVRTVVTSVAYLAFLLRTLRRVDVVHAFSASYWSYLLAPLPAMIVARMLGKRVVLNYRSGEAADHLARWPMSRRTMSLANEVVVPSGYLVDVFAKFGFTARPIANFVELDRIPYRRRTSLHPHFLANRNLEPLYDVACIIRAVALVQREYSDTRLTVAGDGAERSALEALVRELGVRNVQFLGRVAPTAMPALYDAADIYVNTPRIDNMPSSIIEAFAAGTPVVTSDAGGIPYIVQQERTGLIVPAGDHAKVADAALRLLRDPALALRLADAARAECESRYRWSAVAGEWDALYSSVIGRAPSSAAAPTSATRSGSMRAKETVA